MSPPLDPSKRSGKPTAKLELCLFAPYNEVVQLLGSWNGFEAVTMKRGDDGWWRAEVALPDGEHQYKFRVKSKSYFCLDQMVEVFDPYALSVTPGQEENSILVMKDGRRQWVDYRWKHDAHPLPANGEMVMYELHVGDFAGQGKRGTFNEVIAKLDYLCDLGVNCIELMPVKEFPGQGWGYSLRSLFAVENSYGRPEDLCRLIDECHGRGMRVVLDGVYNHADKESPLAKIAYEYWFYKDNPDPPEMHWGPKFNFEHFDSNLKLFPARKYVIDSILFWVEKFHIDGVRFDATRALGNFDMMRQLADAAYAKINGSKHFVTVAEHVPEDPAITGRERGAPMDAAWHDRLAHHIQEMLCCKLVNIDQLLELLDPARNGFEKPERMVNYVTTHDQDRILTLLCNQAQIVDGAAFRRVKLGFGLVLTAPGIPLLWMGSEFGFAADKSLEPRPLDWDLLSNPRNRDLHDYVQRLFTLRRQTPALQGETMEVLMRDPQRQIFATKRWNAEGNVVIIAANLKDEHAGEFTVEGHGLEDGLWRQRVHDYDVEVKQSRLTDSLGPSEVKIYVKK